MLMMVVVAVGCNRAQKPNSVYLNLQSHLEQGGDFNWLLMRAGVEPEYMPSSQEITVQQAQDLRKWVDFMMRDGHMASYGPRKTVQFLMEEIIAQGQPMARAALNLQLSRFQSRFVLRPDGYVVDALWGKPLHIVGPLRLEKGVIMVAGLKLEPFYRQEGNVLREDLTLVIHQPPPTGNKLSTAQR
jgi:hypothetical protein